MGMRLRAKGFAEVERMARSEGERRRRRRRRVRRRLGCGRGMWRWGRAGGREMGGHGVGSELGWLRTWSRGAGGVGEVGWEKVERN